MGLLPHNSSTPTATWLRSTKMLKLVVAAAVMLHVVASKPMDVDVEVTVNGVKIPINNDRPGWGGKEKETPKSGQYTDWYKKGEEPPKSGQYTDWYKKGEEPPKSGGYGYHWGRYHWGR